MQINATNKIQGGAFFGPCSNIYKKSSPNDNNESKSTRKKR